MPKNREEISTRAQKNFFKRKINYFFSCVKAISSPFFSAKDTISRGFQGAKTQNFSGAAPLNPPGGLTAPPDPQLYETALRAVPLSRFAASNNREEISTLDLRGGEEIRACGQNIHRWLGEGMLKEN